MLDRIRTKIFADGADLDGIVALAREPHIDGFTTNPTLMWKAGLTDYEEFGRRILDEVDALPISFEVFADDADEMRRQAERIATWGDNVYVKIPVSNTRGESMAALAGALSGEGIKVNVTLCFSPAQALIAAKVGATYISPFVGRLDDIATPGMELIRDIVEIYRNYEYKTEVLVASTRGPMHIVEAARMGADICTCPPAVIDSLFNHPLTDSGLKKFLADWEKAQATPAR